MTKIPRKIKDLLDLSSLAKKEYSRITFKIKIIDFFLCLFSLVTIIFAFLDNYQIVEAYNIFTERYMSSTYNNVLRFLNIAFNLVLVTLVILRYISLVKIHKIKYGPIAESETISSMKMIPTLIVEIILNLIFIPPFLESTYVIEGSISVDYDYTKYFNPFNLGQSSTIETTLISRSTPIILVYSIASIICFFMMIRIYHFFRFFFTFSSWETPKAQTICDWMNTKAGPKFTVKTYLKIMPYTSLVVGLMFIMLVFGFATQVFEYYNSMLMKMMGTSPENTNNGITSTMLSFSNVYSSFWLMLVTMTTVGYGEIYPTTYFGRVVVIIACIVGTFVLSLLVVFLGQTISFDDVERNVYNDIIEYHGNNSNLKRNATKFIGRFLRYCYFSKKYMHDTTCQRHFLFTEMKFLAKVFKNERM